MKRKYILVILLSLLLISFSGKAYYREVMLLDNAFQNIDENRINENNADLYRKSIVSDIRKTVDMDNLIMEIKIIPIEKFNYPFDQYTFFSDGKMLRKEYVRESATWVQSGVMIKVSIMHWIGIND